MKIVNVRNRKLSIDRFEIKPGESWCLYGLNESGINELVKWVAKRSIDGSYEHFFLPEDTGTVSFAGQQALYEMELKNDETDILDRIDPGTPVKSFLTHIKIHDALIDAFEMTSHLDKGYRQLSTGQSRKLMILSRITRGQQFLVLENPFEGLDTRAKNELDKALEHLWKWGSMLLLIVHNQDDIPGWCRHLGVVESGVLKIQGPRNKVKVWMDRNDKRSRTIGLPLSHTGQNRMADSGPAAGEKQALVRLKNGQAGYGSINVFTGLSFTINPGDHTLVTGPNGSGKSTLLHMITGDHPACYTNNLKIFGIKRGSGESIWDLKKHMGILSSDLHRNWLVPGNALQCVLSGLFDSIGLYQKVSREQEKTAKAWLSRVGLERKADLPFRDFHFSQQRLILIARALIKMPKLLILDEPTQGLDQQKRNDLLDFLEQVAKEAQSTILFVSHRQDEHRSFFRQHLEMQGQTYKNQIAVTGQ